MFWVETLKLLKKFSSKNMQERRKKITNQEKKKEKTKKIFTQVGKRESSKKAWKKKQQKIDELRMQKIKIDFKKREDYKELVNRVGDSYKLTWLCFIFPPFVLSQVCVGVIWLEIVWLSIVFLHRKCIKHLEKLCNFALWNNIVLISFIKLIFFTSLM